MFEIQYNGRTRDLPTRHQRIIDENCFIIDSKWEIISQCNFTTRKWQCRCTDSAKNDKLSFLTVLLLPDVYLVT